MPRPCAVVRHAGLYQERRPAIPDATALCRGRSRVSLQKTLASHAGSHGLVALAVTLGSTQERRPAIPDATALSRGRSRWLPNKTPPPLEIRSPISENRPHGHS